VTEKKNQKVEFRTHSKKRGLLENESQELNFYKFIKMDNKVFNEVDKDFNIFQILSVANKELTHSSMIGFLINEGFNFFEDICENDERKFVINFEVAAKLKYEENNKLKTKTVRFDIVINLNDSDNLLEEPFMIIENKYKATPTQDQLKLYDAYFDQKEKSPIKVLMIFFEEQIPSDVKNYCEIHNWKIKSYFSVKESDSSFFCYLNNVDSEFYRNTNKKKQIYLFDEYRAYLKTIQSEIRTIFNDPNILSNEYFKDNRDLQFKYLLLIQSRISNQIFEKDETIVFTSYNDGGSHKIPSVGLWFGQNFYLSIDGNRLKIGFSYNQNNENNNARKKELTEYIKNFESLSNFQKSIRDPKTKESENGISKDGENRISVMSIFTIDTNIFITKNELISFATNLFIEYYNIVKRLI
jgi:hypothetical protein